MELQLKASQVIKNTMFMLLMRTHLNYQMLVSEQLQKIFILEHNNMKTLDQLELELIALIMIQLL